MKINDLVKILDFPKHLTNSGFANIGEITGIDDIYSFFHVRVTNADNDSLVLSRWKSDLELIGEYLGK